MISLLSCLPVEAQLLTIHTAMSMATTGSKNHREGYLFVDKLIVHPSRHNTSRMAKHMTITRTHLAATIIPAMPTEFVMVSLT
jgi:hypothetical protein